MTANYKLQAERLINHFSDVHRFRLKPARALEAIAAVHGAKDWNTLHALSVPSTAPQPLAMHPGPVEPSDSLFTPITLDAPRVANQVLTHRMLVQGTDLEARAAVLKHLVTLQANRGSAVYFDLSANGRKERALEWLGTAGKLTTKFDPAQADLPSFEALAEANTEQALRLLLNLLPLSVSVGGDFFRQQAETILHAVLTEFQESGQRLTLTRLHNTLTRTEKEPGWTRHLPEGWLPMPTHCSPILGRIALLVNAFGDSLSPTESPEFSWADTLRTGRSVYVRAGGTPVAETIASMLRDGLNAAMTNLDFATPVTVFVVGDGAQQFAKRSLNKAAQHAGAGVIVFDTYQDHHAGLEQAAFDVLATVRPGAAHDSGLLCLEELVSKERRTAQIGFQVPRSF